MYSFKELLPNDACNKNASSDPLVATLKTVDLEYRSSLSHGCLDGQILVPSLMAYAYALVQGNLLVLAVKNALSSLFYFKPVV